MHDTCGTLDATTTTTAGHAVDVQFYCCKSPAYYNNDIIMNTVQVAIFIYYVCIYIDKTYRLLLHLFICNVQLPDQILHANICNMSPSTHACICAVHERMHADTVSMYSIYVH